MDIVSILFALTAGIFTAIEHTINGRLGNEITPSAASLHNLLTGAAFMLLINLVRGNIVNYSRITRVSPLLLIGGLFGASIIYLSAKSVPKLGTTTTLVLILAGQMICGLITDVFLNGLAVGWSKWIGIAFVLSGAYLMVR